MGAGPRYFRWQVELPGPAAARRRRARADRAPARGGRGADRGAGERDRGGCGCAHIAGQSNAMPERRPLLPFVLAALAIGACLAPAAAGAAKPKLEAARSGSRRGGRDDDRDRRLEGPFEARAPLRGPRRGAERLGRRRRCRCERETGELKGLERGTPYGISVTACGRSGKLRPARLHPGGDAAGAVRRPPSRARMRRVSLRGRLQHPGRRPAEGRPLEPDRRRARRRPAPRLRLEPALRDPLRRRAPVPARGEDPLHRLRRRERSRSLPDPAGRPGRGRSQRRRRPPRARRPAARQPRSRAAPSTSSTARSRREGRGISGPAIPARSSTSARSCSASGRTAGPPPTRPACRSSPAS